MTHTTRTTATTIAAAALLALTACNPTTNTNAGNNTQNTPATTAPSTTNSDTNPATQTPEQRITGFFTALDASASKGWNDFSYASDFLTPEVAKAQIEGDKQDAKNKVVITGKRELTNMSTVEETDTQAVVEFCNDVTDLKATKNGKPVTISNSEPGVARFTLTRESNDKPWMISEQGYYDKKEVGSCAEYFGG